MNIQNLQTRVVRHGPEITLLFGVLLVGSGQTMIFSILPPIAEQLGLLKIQVGTVFTLSALLFTFFSPFWGRKSDALGRKRFIIGGLLGFGISTMAFAAVLHVGLSGVLPVLVIFGGLIIARAVTGISSAATATSGTAFIADSTPPEKRALGMARYTAAYGFGSMLGPALASLFIIFGPAVPLYLLAISAIMIAGLIYMVLPKTVPKQTLKVAKKISFKDLRLRNLLLFNVFNGCIISLPLQVIGFYILDRTNTFSPEQFLGVVLSCTAAASLFSQLVLIQHFKIPSIKLLHLGPILIILGQLLIITIESPWIITLAMILTGLGSGVLYPAVVALMSLAVTPDEQGAVSGLATSTSSIGFVISPLVGFGLYEISPVLPFVAILAASVAQLAICWIEFHSTQES